MATFQEFSYSHLQVFIKNDQVRLFPSYIKWKSQNFHKQILGWVNLETHINFFKNPHLGGPADVS